MMQASDGKTVSMQDLAPFIEKKILAGGSVELTVPGNSMRPTLLDRVSKVRLTAIKVPKCGDMVLYGRDNGTFVLHRIVKMCPDGSSVFCGDAQYQLEKGIHREQLIAVVYEFSRSEKWISCDNLIYQCWWRFCVHMRGWRHICAAIRRRMKKPYHTIQK